MSDRHRSIDLVIFVENERNATFGVKKVPHLSIIEQCTVVVGAFHDHIHSPVLQICKKPERVVCIVSQSQSVIQFQVSTHVVLIACIPVIFSGCGKIGIGHGIGSEPKVIPKISGPVKSQIGREGCMTATGSGHKVPHTAPDKIGVVHGTAHNVVVVSFFLVILVIPVAFGKMKGMAPRECRTELVSIVQLHMVLGIVIGLVGVIPDISLIVCVFPGRVVPAVPFQILPGYAFPGDTGMLLAVNIIELK